MVRIHGRKFYEIRLIWRGILDADKYKVKRHSELTITCSLLQFRGSRWRWGDCRMSYNSVGLVGI